MTAWLISLGFFATIIVATSAVVAGLWRMAAPRMAVMAPRAELRLLQIFAWMPLVVFGLSLIASGEWSGREGGGERREHREHTSARVVLVPTEGRGAERRGEHGREWSEHREGFGRKHELREGAGSETTALRRLLLGGLILVGLLFLGRFLLALGRECHGIVTSWRTANTLRNLATVNEHNYLVLPQDKPEAFVLGLLRPTLFVSHGLLQLPSSTVNAVIAHEKAHIQRRDPLRHLLILLACTFHLPSLSERLHKRTQQVQELVADEIAAQSIGNPTEIAEALLCCAKLQSDHGRLHLSFNGGDLAERIKALIADDAGSLQPARSLIALLIVLTFVLAVNIAGIAHHMLESLAR